jgi:four helix bundle protein
MSAFTYRDLLVWQQSFELVKAIYSLTAKLPSEEKYCLCDQARRCAVSIPSNIAEGQQRHNAKEFRQFLGIAKGSSAELETQVMLMKDLYALDTESILESIRKIQKMIQALSMKIQPNK